MLKIEVAMHIHKFNVLMKYIIVYKVLVSYRKVSIYFNDLYQLKSHTLWSRIGLVFLHEFDARYESFSKSKMYTPCEYRTHINMPSIYSLK